jgi:hypothetical protein
MIDVPALVVRDGILVIAWLTAVYLVFMLLTLAQLGRQRGLRGSMDLNAGEVEGEPIAVMPDLGDPAARLNHETPALHLSPRYEVAVSLAFQGFDVASIARRCDISVAEARLVATLAESYQGLETVGESPYGRALSARIAA